MANIQRTTKKSVKKNLKNETIHVIKEIDVQKAVSKAMVFAQILGFKRTEQYMIGTAVSELARNIIRFAVKGEVILSSVTEKSKKGIQIVARDQGPGIENIELAMQDHYSTFPGSLGVGLPGVKRLTDHMTIKCDKGTIVMARKWLKSE